MNAPLQEFVQRYAASKTSRLHMPGHKGRGPLGCEAFDITEIAGADALYEASGIIAESEANATALFGTQRTFYSTEGSSHCIRAMLHLAMTIWQEDAARNAAMRGDSETRRERSATLGGASEEHERHGAARGGFSERYEERSAARCGVSEMREECVSARGGASVTREEYITATAQGSSPEAREECSAAQGSISERYEERNATRCGASEMREECDATQRGASLTHGEYITVSAQGSSPVAREECSAAQGGFSERHEKRDVAQRRASEMREKCVAAQCDISVSCEERDSAQGGFSERYEDRDAAQRGSSVTREECTAAQGGFSEKYEERDVAQGGVSVTREKCSAKQGGASNMRELCFTTDGTSAHSACPASARTFATGNSPLPLPRPVALAGRNAHRAFLTAAALDDFDVEWLWPEEAVDSPCACPITAEGLARRLDAMECPPFCVYVTSPDYLGGMLDIQALSEVCHARGVPLLVDNAHGAYLKFLPERLHPMELGADLCCDSAHKTLPVLTGGAYLHIGRGADPRYAEGAKRALALFGSTSPSYLILQSLDCANVRLAGDFPAKLAECRARVEELKALLAKRGFEVLPSEPMKLSLHTDGPQAAALLRASRVEPEMVEREHVVLMFSPDNSPEDFARVERALTAPPPFSPAPKLACPEPPRALTIREASFAPSELVPVERAVNRICAAPTAPCPPAISLAVPGERITPALAALLKRCGMDNLAVVRM